MDKFRQFITTINSVFISGEFLLLLIYAIFTVILIWVMKLAMDSKIDFSDLILGPDNKVSATKLTQIGSFSVTTWGFVFLIIEGKLSEWYFSAYIIAWAGAQLANKFLVNKTHTDKMKFKAGGEPPSDNTHKGEI